MLRRVDVELKVNKCEERQRCMIDGRTVDNWTSPMCLIICGRGKNVGVPAEFRMM